MLFRSLLPVRLEAERGSPLRKCRIGLDHLAKQRESASASASRAAMMRTPTRFRWASRVCAWVAPVVVGGDAVVALLSLLLLLLWMASTRGKAARKKEGGGIRAK